MFVGWGLFFIYVLFRFRKGANPKASYTGAKGKISKGTEVAVAIVEVILLVFYAIPAWTKRVKALPSESEAVVVKVVGEQFAWNVQYPGPDGKFGRTDVKLVAADNPLGLDRRDPDAKDDITTINQLNLPIDRPVLVGHSIAGEELSSVGTRHPERVAGLVYLDAAYAYGYYDRSIGDVNMDSRELQKKLEQLRANSTPQEHKQLVQELLQQDLPDFEKELVELQKYLQAEPAHPVAPPAPTADDLASFPAYRAYVSRVRGFTFPESELRQDRESRPDGGVGKNRDTSSTSRAITEGAQKYTAIQVPVLAIFANPRDPGPYSYNAPAERAATEALQTAGIEAIAKAFENGVPSARVVRVPHSTHYVFLSNEADVLREINAFLAGLH